MYLGRSTVSTRPMRIYMAVGVLLQHFQFPAARKNYNANMTIEIEFFQICFLTKHKLR